MKQQVKAEGKWNLLGIEDPEEGQLCEVKITVSLKAYYMPKCKQGVWVTPDEKQELNPISTEWKAIEGSEKMEGFRELPEDINEEKQD